MSRTIQGIFAGFAFAVALWAQAPRAYLRLKVVDENGAPVADATLRMSAPAVRIPALTSDATGHAIIKALPPGSYRLQAAHSGYFLLTTTIKIVPGENRVDLTLHHATEVTSRVEVVASASPVHPLRTRRTESIVATEIRNLPFTDSHNLQRAIAALPGALTGPNGDLHISGGENGETEYTLNGFLINNPATEATDASVDIDTVRSVQVTPGAAGADASQAASGILALRTQTGSDHWHFSAVNFPPGVSFQQGLHLGAWVPRFGLSGPIRRGHAWFNDGLSFQHGFQLISGLPNGANTDSTWNAQNLLNGRWNLSPTQALIGNFLVNYNSNPRFGLGPLSPLSTTQHQQSSRVFLSGQDQWTLGTSLLDLGAAWDAWTQSNTPQGTAPYAIEPQGTAGNYFEDLHQSTHRSQLLASFLSPLQTAWGEQDLNFGADLQWIAYSQTAQRSPVQIFGNGGQLERTSSFNGSGAVSFPQRLAGFYAQDGWDLSRSLRLEFGGRVDADSLAQGAVWQPRVSLRWLPSKTNGSKLYAATGLYFFPVTPVLYAQTRDQARTENLSGMSTPLFTSFGIVPGGIESPRWWITEAGWAQQVGASTFYGVGGLLRRERDGLGFVANPAALSGQPTPPAWLLANQRRDRYWSADLWVRHSFHEIAELYGDYMRSQDTTNEAYFPSLENFLLAPQMPGPLPWDTPNRFLSWGWDKTHIWGLLLSYEFEYRTGFPFSLVTPGQQLSGNLNTQRFPNFMQLNVGFEKTVPFHNNLWALRMVVVNILGRANPTAVVNTVGAPNFLAMYGGQGRAFTFRLRWVGRR